MKPEIVSVRLGSILLELSSKPDVIFITDKDDDVVEVPVEELIAAAEWLKTKDK